MLVVTKCSLPESTNGRANVAAIRSAVSIASRSEAMSSSRIPNSSPPNRATVSLRAQRLLEPRRRGRQQLVADVVPEAVVDELEVVEVEEQDRGQRALAAEPRERVLEAVDEQHPVGKAGQRIVHGPLADRVLDGLALERVGQHVGQRLEEVDVARRRTLRGAHRLDHQYSERPARAALDLHRQPAPVRRPRSPAARSAARRPSPRPPPARRSAACSPPAIPRRRDTGALPTVDVGPADPARSRRRPRSAGVSSHTAEISTPSICAAPVTASCISSVVLAPSRACSPSKRHRRLLGGASLELGLDLLAIGDVGEDAVPAELATRPAHEYRVVADPHHAAVAMEHPVLERGAVGLPSRPGRLRSPAPIHGRRGAVARPTARDPRTTPPAV